MSVWITALRRRSAGKGGDKFFLLFGDGRFATATGAVGEPREQKFFAHPGTQFGIERLPVFMDFVKSVAPSADAMNFDAVILLDLTVGQFVGGGEDNLCAGLGVFSKAAGAKDVL